jgi:hypothetical protein
MAWYWAYDEDMDEATLRARCPGAKKVTTAKILAARPAFLAYEEGEAVMDVSPDPKADMWGVLYFIPDTELMNVREGAARRKQVRFRPVWDPENRAYNAYLLEGDGDAPDATPPKEKAERVFGLAVSHDLPEKYVSALAEIKGK